VGLEAKVEGGCVNHSQMAEERSANCDVVCN